MSQLPNAELAFIEEEKITAYLLSVEHPRGRHKAAFFMRFGFKIQFWRELERSLLKHARESEVFESEETPFGAQYALEGALRTPDGRGPLVRTVWAIDRGRDRPRFLTAYPARRKRRRERP